ncbi:unnamed protein product [Clavelina lepadiformis]|uniref:DDE Tnp4 domain-containing protein n=1 Tax=Clavelina lepadiformis TaxID=159417 RepID=A0ABP0FF04_CLALP
MANLSRTLDFQLNFRLRRATASILLLGSLTVNESPMHRKPLVLLMALPKPLFRHKAASCNRPADLSQFEDPFQVIFDAGFVLSKQPRMKMDGKLFSRTCFHRAASVFFCKELTYAKLSKTPTKELKGCLCSNRHLADSVNLIYLINIQALFDRDGQSFAHVGLSVADLSQFEDPFQVIFDAGFVLSKQPRMKMDGKLFSRTCFHRAASVFFCKELTYAKLSKTPTKELKEMANLSRTLDFQLNFRLRRATASILLLGSLTVNESPMHRKPLVLLMALPKPLFRHKAASCNRPDLSQFEDPFQVIFDAGFVLSKQPRMKMDGKLFSRTCFHRAASVFFCKELTYAKLSKTPTKELKGCLCSNRHLADSVNLIYLINIQALFDRDGQSFAHVGLSVEFPSSTSDCIHFVAGKPDCKRKPYASQAIGTADGATKTIVST